MITRAYEVAADAHRGQLRTQRRELHQPPAGRGHRSSPTSASTTSRSPPPCCTTRSRTPRSRSPTSSATFGAEVAAIVDGVTKLERLQFDSKEAQQAATMRKMLVAMAKDLRVLIIKLADRLHNMRTHRRACRSEKQQRIAQETLDIYAPLAHRLGMQEMKQQLEDLSFAALHPKRYAEIDHMVGTRTPEREVYLAQVLAEVRGRLRRARTSRPRSPVAASTCGASTRRWS